MAPIVSPKILSQIMMYGCAVEMSKASYVKLPYADLKSCPVAICKPTVLILGSLMPRQRRVLAPFSNKASYTSLPNSTFIIAPEDTCSEVCLRSEEMLVPETSSISTVNWEGEVSEQLEPMAPESMESLEVYPENGSVESRVSSVVSTAASTFSIKSTCEPPSTAATSIPPWDDSRLSENPFQKFGAPPTAGYARSCSPVDSLDIIRLRRASEAAGAGPSTTFTPRTRKFSDVRGLKGLGLRGLEILKKVKW